MEDLLDALKRIVSRWVETTTPITSTVEPGDRNLDVSSSVRLNRGDEVLIEDPTEGEPNLMIEDVVDDTHIKLSHPAFNRWHIDRNPHLRKLTNGMYIEGIYIGEPQVIPRYPAITIFGTDVDSEWLTLDSTKESYSVTLTIYVEASTYEDGYRFLMKLSRIIREGLKRNFYPLLDDYDVTSLVADVKRGDRFIRVKDTDIFVSGKSETSQSKPWDSDVRLFIEDRWKSEELKVKKIIDDEVIEVVPRVCHNFNTDNNPIAIQPKRFIYNSWPYSTSFGNSNKNGTLLQSAVINWFAWEEEIFKFRNIDPHLK